jgi:TRAP-type mannitol/chloroaromatic compound transport system substrate-binding protein
MINLKSLLFLLFLATSFSFTSYAAVTTETNKINNTRNSEDFQKIIDEYKSYVAKISPEIRQEVIDYRKEVAKLNKEKKLLYRKLSQDGQDYLKKEQEYKKKLPMLKKGSINFDDFNK